MSETRKRNSTITINQAYCKKCGICQAFCPKQVLGSDELGMVVVLNPEQCIACKRCERLCPDFAISIEVENND
ncbi:MAG: 4Fe-4S dicluster domain-containing protein [Desulfitobacteriia bacterium]